MLRTLASVVGVLVPSLLTGGCCFDLLGSTPSNYLYTDMLAPPGASVIVWPADEDAHLFRYVTTSDMGYASGPRVVREIGLPPDASFAHYLPKDARGITVLLPAERLAELRPRAQLLLDAAAALRPELATSITPVPASALEHPLIEIRDVAEFDAALERLLHEHRMMRPRSFADAFAGLYWIPKVLVVPLEPDADGERYALLDSIAWGGDEPAREDRIVDWDGFVAAVEAARVAPFGGPVTAWVLEPEDASEAQLAQIDRLMVWIGELEGDLVVWARRPFPAGLPADASAQDVREWFITTALDEEADPGRTEVRMRYDPERFEPDFLGWFVGSRPE